MGINRNVFAIHKVEFRMGLSLRLVASYESWTVVRTPELKIRVWSWSLDPIDSIGWPLSIAIGLNLPAEGISD